MFAPKQHVEFYNTGSPLYEGKTGVILGVQSTYALDLDRPGTIYIVGIDFEVPGGWSAVCFTSSCLKAV